MNRRLLCIAVVLICHTIALAQSSDVARFKRSFKPQVGKILTVEGTLRSAKLGYLVAFRGWGIYLYNTKESDVEKMNGLSQFEGQTVKVTGTLRYAPAPVVTPGADAVAQLPEHFYFDVAEVKIVRVKSSTTKTQRTQKKTN